MSMLPEMSPRASYKLPRSRPRGQGMVEFALIAPVFFLLIFAMLDGGMLLFTTNSVANATTVGSNALSALGNNSMTDFTTIRNMAGSGFGGNGLVKVLEIDIDGLVQGPVGFKTDPATGNPQIMTGCPTASDPCRNKYTESITPNGDVTVTELTRSGVALCSYTYPAAGPPGVFTCPDQPWPPSARNVANGTSSFAALTVQYTYTYFTGIARPLTLSATKTLRLEPQS